MTIKNIPASTDPSVYESHHRRFQDQSLPTGSAAWTTRAQDVANILAIDAAERDIEGKSPVAEVSLLKSSGLTRLLGPMKYGGGGQTWEVGYRVIREVAEGDGSIAMLLGYHLLWTTTANVVGTDQQKDSVQELIIKNNYFVGGAVNPRDGDLKITQTQDGSSIVFNGFKNFNTGGVVSDLTVLEGAYDGTQDHIFTFVKTDQPGIDFKHNWDNIGLRLSESGSVSITNVKVPWTDALGWDAATKKPIPSILKIPYATLLLPTIQLVFSSFYLGITAGALQAATGYAKTKTRPWPYISGGSQDPNSAPAQHATDEFYILERMGNFAAHLRAAEALADSAGKAITELYASAERGVTNGHGNGHINGHSGHDSVSREAVTAQARGQVAELVASVKIVATDTGLRVTGGMMEVTGARATARKAGMDRFWRDVRTHALHDPVAYKNREVGRYVLLGEIPEPTWYT